MGERILQETRSHLSILDARRLTWSKVHVEDPQTSGAAIQSAAIQNFVTMATRCWDVCIPGIKCLMKWCVSLMLPYLERMF